MGAMREVRYAKDALRALRKIARGDAQRVREKVQQYAEDPDSLAANVKRLTGDSLLRLRVGDYRVIMDDDGTILLIVKVGHRREVYR